VPLIIPIVVLTISIYLIAAPIIENPQIEYLYAALFIVAGLIFYVPFVYYGVVPWFMGMYAFPHRLLYSHICANLTYIVSVSRNVLKTSIVTAFMLDDRHSIPDRNRVFVGELCHLSYNAFQYRDIQMFRINI
jgi:hypothetical protein